MARYRVVYTIYAEVEADSHDEALDIVSDWKLDDMIFDSAEVERLADNE